MLDIIVGPLVIITLATLRHDIASHDVTANKTRLTCVTVHEGIEPKRHCPQS